jgi:5-formyltetrahydrofolate cyclo-ligase
LLVHSKIELRRKYRKLGEELLSSAPSLNDQLLQTLLKSDLNLKKGNIGLYYHRNYELNLLTLWENFPDRVYFPLTHPQSLQLHYYLVSHLRELKAGFGNVMEPIASEATRLKTWNSGDVIFIPGLSFDEEGFRLGSGKGIFDRYLASLPPSVITVGVCLEEQLSIPQLPRESHDIPVKMIVTPKRLIKVV